MTHIYNLTRDNGTRISIRVTPKFGHWNLSDERFDWDVMYKEKGKRTWKPAFVGYDDFQYRRLTGPSRQQYAEAEMLKWVTPQEVRTAIGECWSAVLDKYSDFRPPTFERLKALGVTHPETVNITFETPEPAIVPQT